MKGIEPREKPGAKKWQRLYRSLSIVFLLTGGIFIFASVIWLRMDSHCKSSPTSITIAKLAAEGPPQDNWYLHVTDYTISDTSSLATTGSSTEQLAAALIGANDRLEGFLFPKDGSTPARTIKFYNLDIDNKEDAEEFIARASMDVLVRDPIHLHEFQPSDKVIYLQVTEGGRGGGSTGGLIAGTGLIIAGLFTLGLSKSRAVRR